MSKVITPLTKKTAIDLKKIAVLDIETIVINEKLQPYAIGLILKNKIKFFYITDYYKGNFILASQDLIKDFILYIDSLKYNYTFFAHNLGGFDGYFILKQLLHKQPKILIDDQNGIITMSLKNSHNYVISFKDSLRIFPRSLADLSMIYDVENKKSTFDHKSVTTDLILYNKEFKESLDFYLTNDLRSLEQILFKAATYLLDKYNVSLLDCFSTASLGMKIFRTNHVEKEVNEIPILPIFYDKILRNAYLGGVVNVYKPTGNNLYYYDINSLYPYAMKNAMPGKLIKTHYGNIKIENFFGFIYAQIIIPEHLNISYACIRDNDSLVSPVGKIKGLYFSEELKAFQKWGYKVNPIFGFEHDKIYPFNTYVDHFYEIKKTTEGGERYITKLLLNGLYGYFGRKPIDEVIETIPQSELNWYLKRFNSRFIIEFEDSYYAIIKRDILPDKELCDTFNINYNDLYRKSKETSHTNSNVAIAAAITAYARIRIHSLIDKCGGNIYYMDTDSLYTDKPIPSKYISEELGYLKDELKGDIIQEAYFVAPKVYGFRQVNFPEPTIKAKSIKKDQIAFDHIKKLYKGEIIQFPVTRLFKDIESLSLLQKNFNITISRDESNSKRINVFDKSGNWIDTKPIVLYQKMTWYEYWMYIGKFLPKKYFLKLIHFTFKE